MYIIFIVKIEISTYIYCVVLFLRLCTVNYRLVNPIYKGDNAEILLK